MTYPTANIGQPWELVVRDQNGNIVRVEKLHTTPGFARQFAADAAKEYHSGFSLVVWPHQRAGRELVRTHGTAKTNWEHLTSAQRKLADHVEQLAGADGLDIRDVLIGQDAPAKDKAAVSDLFGGAGAGAEFRHQHIAKRSRCRRPCDDEIVFLDGIRDPYWTHEDRLGPRHPKGQPIIPNDARTRCVFEKSR